VSITLDGDFAVHDVKVIEGPQRLFVAMPSRKDENGVFRDIVHPITSEARAELEERILEAYQSHLERTQNLQAIAKAEIPPDLTEDSLADSQQDAL